MIVVYGAGSAAKSLIGCYPDFKNAVIATTDGGGVFLNKPVHKFSGLSISHINEVVVASSFADEICSYLEALGVDSNIIRIYYPENQRLIPFSDVKRVNSGKVLYAFYDLAANPATYDVVVFVVRAELYARIHGYGDIHYLIVPPAFRCGRPGDLGFYEFNDSMFEWKCKNIVAQVMSLGASSQGVSHLVSRDEVRMFLSEKSADVFPKSYATANPRDEHTPTDISDQYLAMLPYTKIFSVPGKEEEIVKNLLERFNNKTILTVTLREYSHQVDRNNNLSEWGIFLRSLDQTKYQVVVVRDTEKICSVAPPGWEGFFFFDAASVSVALRLALYSAASINLFCNNGPAYLASFLLNSRYIIFNMTGGKYPSNSAEFFWKRFRLRVGDSSYFWSLNKYQRLVWEKDSSESLTNNFFELERDMANENN